MTPPLTLTTAMVAAAVVASARSYGDPPDKAMDPASARRERRSLTAAADALQRYTGQSATTISTVLQIRDTSLHHARKSAAEAFVSASAAAFEALAIFGPAYVKPPEPPRPPRPSLRVVDPAPVATVPPAPPAPAPVSNTTRVDVETPARRPLPTARPKARANGAAYGRATSVRLKALTPRKTRYCKRFLRAGWPLEEVAWLFDIDPDALAVAARPLVA